MDAVGGEDRLAVQGELVLGVGEPGHEGGEPGAHAPEDQLVTDLLEEFCLIKKIDFDFLFLDRLIRSNSIKAATVWMFLN